MASSIEQDILDWAKGRPEWQRNLLKRVARGEAIDDDYIEATAKAIVAKLVALETPELETKDLPTGLAGGSTMSLLSVGDLKNVNALLGGHALSFGTSGVTVIYGDNGSGKSGYARLVKSVVGARHREDILPDAYATSTGDQSAKITYAVNGTETAGSWPEVDEPALGQVHFYDEACGDDYLQRETELAYRPSVLTLLDRLIVQVDRVRGALDSLISANEAKALVWPAVPATTAAQKFIDELSAKTTVEQIDAATALEDGAIVQYAALVTEEGRLKGTNPATEKSRLLAAAAKVEVLADHLDSVDELLSPATGDGLLELQTKAKELRSAANDASKVSFADEPLSGVGSTTWRAMWAAAERYSQTEAYVDRDFPATDNGDVCVLCQQPLAGDAQGRLQRFHAFVHNDVARQAKDAEDKFSEAVETLTGFNVTSADTEAAITFLSTEHKDLATSLTTALDTAKRAKTLIGQRLRGESEEAWEQLADVDAAGLRTLATDVKTKANAIDETAFKTSLGETTSKRAELEGRIALAKIKSSISNEVERLKEVAALRKVQGTITTQAITKESTDVSRKYVTEAVKDRFVRESERLKLEHVVLGDKGGAKGKLRHQPALLGTSGRSPMQVLSEGEQTAAGLAGFFTEIEFDATKSTVVFDDPVSSFDHERRDRAARRIVEVATDRQVIVFTHDLMFLGEIVKVAEELDVTLTERAIERKGQRKPGFVVEGYPWKAKDAKKRLHDLPVELDQIKKDQATMTSENYERAIADWAGKLSETWERIVRSEVAYKLVDRGTTEVRPRMFKVIARITEADNTDFQTGYGATSKWARRHDKSEEVNYTAPTVDDMQAELDRIKAWRDRVSKYENG